MFDNLSWLTVNQLTFYHSSLSTFRIRSSREPEYLSSILSSNNRAERIIIPNTDLTLAKNSYCYRGTAQWNSLPQQIRTKQKIGQFNTKLKKWINSMWLSLLTASSPATLLGQCLHCPRVSLSSPSPSLQQYEVL